MELHSLLQGPQFQLAQAFIFQIMNVARDVLKSVRWEFL